MNRPITSNEIETVIKNLPNKPDGGQARIGKIEKVIKRTTTTK